MNTRNFFQTLLAIVLFTCTLQGRTQDIMTNADLIQMAELGMGDAIILSQIENSNNDFNVSTSALMTFKKAGLSDAVLAKVIEAANNSSKKVVDANDPLAPHRPGIYYKDDGGNMVELLPSVTSQSKTKGVLATRMSYGIAKTRVVSRISGGASRTQFYSPQTFYFYFNQQSASFDQNAITFYGFQQATSPSEFTLALLDKQVDVRELETASVNNYTAESGIDEKHARAFDIEQIAPGIFKVTARDLAPGEYCFVYSGAAPYGHTQQKVFDFGIK